MDSVALLILDLESLSLEKRVPEVSRSVHKQVNRYKRKHNGTNRSPHHKRLCITPQQPCLAQLSVEDSASLRSATRLRAARPGGLKVYRRDYINGQGVCINDLPDALLTGIMTECSSPDLERLSRTSRRMQIVVTGHRRSAALIELHHRYKKISKYAPSLDTGDWTSAVELRDYLCEMDTVAQEMIQTLETEILALTADDEQFPQDEQELAVCLQNIIRPRRPYMRVAYKTARLPDSWRSWAEQAVWIISIVCFRSFDSEPYARSFLEDAPTLAILLLRFHFLLEEAINTIKCYRDPDSYHSLWRNFDKNAAVRMIWRLSMNREASARKRMRIRCISSALEQHDMDLANGTAISRTHTKPFVRHVGACGERSWLVDRVSRLDLIMKNRLSQDCGRDYGILDMKDLDEEIGRRMAGDELTNMHQFVRERCFLSNHRIFQAPLPKRSMYSTRSLAIAYGMKFDHGRSVDLASVRRIFDRAKANYLFAQKRVAERTATEKTDVAG